MNFFNKALNIAKNITESFLSHAEEKANEHRQVKEELEPKNDKELISILNDDSFFSESSRKKNVAYGILRNRGFSDEDLNYKKT